MGRREMEFGDIIALKGPGDELTAKERGRQASAMMSRF